MCCVGAVASPYSTFPHCIYFHFFSCRGVWSSLQLDILPHLYFWILILFPKFLFPLRLLMFFLTAWISWQEKSYCFPFPFFYVIFFPTVLILTSPFHNLIFFPNILDKISLSGTLPPPLFCAVISTEDNKKNDKNIRSYF